MKTTPFPDSPPPPPRPGPFSEAWTRFRSLPVWGQILLWVVAWPLLLPLLIVSGPAPTRGQYAAAAVVLLIAATAWVAPFSGSEDATEPSGAATDETEGVTEPETEPEAEPEAETEVATEPEPEDVTEADEEAEAAREDARRRREETLNRQREEREAAQEEAETEAEPERTAPSSTTLEAEIRYNVEGLHITAAADYTDCTVDLNAGLVRSGYTAKVARLPAGVETFVAFFDLTNRSSERFNVFTVNPETIAIRCAEAANYWEF